MPAPVIGIDFGTSNTAAAVMAGGRPQVIPLEPGHDTLPTAVFLDFARRQTVYGRDAVAALTDGRDGRFMRALKSILGTPLARERRAFLNERLTLIEVVARFLTEVRRRASDRIGDDVRAAVAGRPVHFHSDDPARDAQAAADLAECYAMAGFDHVRFLPEPEAAARSCGAGRGTGLIVDIGGGTSDFTLFRGEGDGITVLASHGVRVGGTDFDRALSLAQVMPLFGMGGELRNLFGKGRNAVPPAIYLELAAWERIAFLYRPEVLRDARDMARLAVDPRRMGRLVTVLDMHLGHDVAFAVEAGKIAANAGQDGVIDLSAVEPGLRPVLASGDLAPILWPLVTRIGAGAEATLARAAVGREAVERVILVGGSSLMRVIEADMRGRFPAAAFVTSDVFTAVVNGLAIAAGAGETGASC